LPALHIKEFIQVGHEYGNDRELVIPQIAEKKKVQFDAVFDPVCAVTVYYPGIVFSRK
jgi:hypothetical protein